MNTKLRAGYVAILNYVGLEVQDDDMIYDPTKPEKPILTAKGLYYCLPTKENLREPHGKQPFHILNESYIKPVGEAYDKYRKYNLFTTNLRFMQTVTFFIELLSDEERQESIKGTELTEIFSKIEEEVDISLVAELRDKVFTAAIVKNGPGAFVDFYISPNDSIGEDNFCAVGKVKFPIYTEVVKGLNKEEHSDYRIYDKCKMRKKDLIVLKQVLEVLFPGVVNPSVYNYGTNNKLFRYLDALLGISYSVNARINQLMDWIDADLGQPEFTAPLRADMEWVDLIEELRTMKAEIERIPNQDDVSETSIPRLKSPTAQRKEEESGERETSRRTTDDTQPVFIPMPKEESHGRERRNRKRDDRRSRRDDDNGRGRDSGDFDDILQGKVARDGSKFRSRRSDYQSGRSWYDEDDDDDGYYRGRSYGGRSGWIEKVEDEREEKDRMREEARRDFRDARRGGRRRSYEEERRERAYDRRRDEERRRRRDEPSEPVVYARDDIRESTNSNTSYGTGNRGNHRYQ